MRHVRSMLVCLALGVVTTIAVSWLCCVDVGTNRTPMSLSRADLTNGEWVSISRRERFGAVSLAAVNCSIVSAMSDAEVPVDNLVPGWADEELLGWTRAKQVAALPSGAARAVLATGWPWVSMWSSYDQQPGGGYWWFKSHSGIKVSAAPANPDYRSVLSPRELALPLRIVPGGFALGVLFWAALWWLVLFGRRAAVRFVRIRRGRCPACAYDRRGLGPDTPCPECGLMARRAVNSPDM